MRAPAGAVLGGSGREGYRGSVPVPDLGSAAPDPGDLLLDVSVPECERVTLSRNGWSASATHVWTGTQWVRLLPGTVRRGVVRAGRPGAASTRPAPPSVEGRPAPARGPRPVRPVQLVPPVPLQPPVPPEPPAGEVPAAAPPVEEAPVEEAPAAEVPAGEEPGVPGIGVPARPQPPAPQRTARRPAP